MFLRARRDGLRIAFSQPTRLVPHHLKGTPSPQVRAHSNTCALASHNSPRPLVLHCQHPNIARLQLRVLRTLSHTKQDHLPRNTAPPLNWSSTAHRSRHLCPSLMTTTTQTRAHAGHSHHHHHDNTFLLSKNKSDAGVRITRIGLYVNLGMAVGKGVGGYVFNSQGMSFQITMTI